MSDEWVQDTLSAIADIQADTAGHLGFMTFSAKPAIVRSVRYSIAIMGEAARSISPAFKAENSDVPWRAMAGIRNKIVLEHSRTNTRRVWDVVTNDIDDLEKALRKSYLKPLLC
ncbi:HepT-like ribonuclease domain-containing protein [Rhodopila sp.]|uniref:HepT-like ribonuclease domain-containing protein n=1 Tax=Rhodopila sp. TaxID=2480087 RepID=UPI003D0FD935